MQYSVDAASLSIRRHYQTAVGATSVYAAAAPRFVRVVARSVGVPFEGPADSEYAVRCLCTGPTNSRAILWKFTYEWQPIIVSETKTMNILIMDY